MKYQHLVLAITAAFACNLANADPVRISTADFVKDTNKVAALEKAITTMKANDKAPNTSTEYRASWQYWANIHGYLTTDLNHPASGRPIYTKTEFIKNYNGCGITDKKCQSYHNHLTEQSVPNDGFTQDVWGNCQHGNLNFLPWHRLYLHFFERTLRKQSGDMNFSLPYWDYFSEIKKDNKVNIALPTLVRGQSAETRYDEFRTPGLNENTIGIPAKLASAAQAFDAKNHGFSEFSKQLEEQPHGNMHCGVGYGCKAPDMGTVPVAALDPVFYMHHANIDRLWQCWLNREAKGAKIDLAWAKQHLKQPDSWYDTKYTFVDENGKPVSMTIADVFNGKIDTHYDKELDCTLKMPTALSVKNIQQTLTLIPMKSDGIVLKGKTKTTPLQTLPTKNLLATSPTATGFKPGNALLIIENVNVEGDPEVTYDIYIGNKQKPGRTVYIATFNYFGIFEGHHHSDEASGTASTGNIGTLTYDIQDELLELGVTSTADVTVNFVPSNFTTEPVKEQETAGSVTVGNIRLLKAGNQ